MIKHLLIFFYFFIACAISAQQPYFKNYQVREGLPSNNVYYIFQDSKGYIWLCTDVGVSRFDGANFTNYTTADGLTDNEVFTCFEDRSGRIWFATLNGKPCFFQHGKIRSERDTPLLKAFNLSSLIFNIHQEASGNLVFGSAKLVGVLDFEQNKAQTYPAPYATVQTWNEPGPNIGILADGSMGNFDGRRFTRFDTLPGIKLPIKHAQKGDLLYIVFSQRLVIYDLKQHRIERQLIFEKPMSEAIAVSVVGERLWIGDRKGAFLFDRETLEMRQHYLPKSQVSGMLEDREGGWWFSTLEHGIYYVPAPEILQYTSSSDGQMMRINCLSAAPDGRLWVGMMESAYGVLEDQSLQLYRHFPSSLKPRAINAIRHLPDGTALLAGKAGLLRIKDGKRSFFRLRSSDVNTDSQGNLWSGLTGLFFIDHKTLSSYSLDDQQLEELVDPPYYIKNPPKRLSTVRVDKIEFDHEGAAWLASPNGLFFFKHGKMSDPVLLHPTRDLLFEPKTQTVWALTESNGLFVLRNGQVQDSISIVNAQLQHVICRSICSDEHGDHWLATASGMFKVEGAPGNLHLLDYSNAYGMGAEKLNAVAVMNGQVFMGKDDGLMAAPVSIFTKKMSPPPVFLKKLVANGREIQSLNLPLQFDFGENSLTFSFEGLSFRDFKRLRYRYRLRGHETEWRTTTSEAVEYASLRPGKYRFEVLAVNTSGVESTKAAVLDFTIAEPFWMKWWFILGLVTTVSGLVWVWVKSREWKLRRKFELQRKLMETENEKLELQKKNADLKMLALRLQMNPHFIFNALNTIKGYYGQEKFTQANSYIAKFARLLRLNLDYSDAFIPLDQEIELLKIYMQLSQIRYPDKMDFKVEVSPEIMPSAVLIPSMVLQPFVENAVIHGIVGKEGRGLIELLFAKSEQGEIVVTVRDDGIGRKAAAAKSKLRDPHKPLATAITQERLQLLRKNEVPTAVEINDVYDENGKVAGTEVVLRLPYNQV